jgi:hypothetical protein
MEGKKKKVNVYIEVTIAALTTGHWSPSPSLATANIQKLVDDTALILDVLHEQVPVASKRHKQIARSVPVTFLHHVSVAAQRRAIQPTSCVTHVSGTQRVEQASPTSRGSTAASTQRVRRRMRTGAQSRGQRQRARVQGREGERQRGIDGEKAVRKGERERRGNGCEYVCEGMYVCVCEPLYVGRGGREGEKTWDGVCIADTDQSWICGGAMLSA